MKQTGVAVLGSTGSIGKSTLDIVSQYPNQFKVVALSAYSSVDVCYEQCVKFKPLIVVMVDNQSATILRERLHLAKLNIEVLSGPESLNTAATISEAQIVVAAIVGAAGLHSSLAAAQSGKKILLANKESLVMAGDLFMRTVKQNRATLLPLDSEHNALFQCMPSDYIAGNEVKNLKQLILTASGGPFLHTDQDDLKEITPEQACKHPTWSMGKKISIDSATLMNKGLEVIEAHWLFNTPVEKIKVIVHPQSVIHSMVEYQDGSILAQMGTPDMRIPIGFSLAWPQRIATNAQPLDFTKLSNLTFLQPDTQKFPCLQYAYDALAQKGVFPLALNSANEVAVSAFIQNKIKFLDIPTVINKVLTKIPCFAVDTIEEIDEADKVARQLANQAVIDLR